MDISYILTRKIQQLSHRIVLRRNKDLKSMGLTAEQADTLLFFHAHSGSSASDLRCSLGVTHQAARALVQRMADKGLLCVTPSPRDARYKLIAPRARSFTKPCSATARTSVTVFSSTSRQTTAKNCLR